MMDALIRAFRRKDFMSIRLFVGNLSHDTTDAEIRSLFSQVGAVESCRLITDRDTGRSRGYAFVQMNSKDAADAVMQKFNGQDLHGRALKINDARPQNENRVREGVF